MNKIVFTLFIFISLLHITACSKESLHTIYNEIDISYSKEFSIEQINQLNITMRSENINILQNNSNSISVVHLGKVWTRKNINISIEDILHVSHTKNALSIRSILNSNSIKRSSLLLEIRVPKNLLDIIHITSTSGDVSIAQLFLSDALNITATSGDITLSDMHIIRLVLETTSGDIRINKAQISRTARLQSTSGNIQAIKLYSSYLKLKSTSGDITISTPSSRVEARSTSGDIDITIDEADDTIDLETTSGDIRLSIPERSQFNIKAHTRSGSIQNAFSLNGTQTEKLEEGTVGEKATFNITLQTSSGDIDIVQE